MRLSKRFRHSLVVWLVRTISVVGNHLPRKVVLSIGSWLGLTAWWLLEKDRYRINRHLKIAYGERLTIPERHRIGRNFFVNSGKNLVDVIRCEKHFKSEILPLIDVEGIEHFDNAYNRGKGMFGVSGHLGNFEVMAAWTASCGYKTAAIGRELSNKQLDRFLVDHRKRQGVTNIATTDSPRKLIQWLRDGGVCGVLIDTDSMRVRSDFVPAFGRLSWAPTGQSLIGLKQGSAFVPIACLRTPDDRYKIIIKPEVTIDRTDDIERDARLMTARCTEVLESFINEYPDQWIWLHNRWHTRPTTGR